MRLLAAGPVGSMAIGTTVQAPGYLVGELDWRFSNKIPSLTQEESVWLHCPSKPVVLPPLPRRGGTYHHSEGCSQMLFKYSYSCQLIFLLEPLSQCKFIVINRKRIFRCLLYKHFEIMSKETYRLHLPLSLVLAKGKNRCPFMSVAY